MPYFLICFPSHGFLFFSLIKELVFAPWFHLKELLIFACVKWTNFSMWPVLAFIFLHFQINDVTWKNCSVYIREATNKRLEQKTPIAPWHTMKFDRIIDTWCLWESTFSYKMWDKEVLLHLRLWKHHSFSEMVHVSKKFPWNMLSRKFTCDIL